MNPPTCVEPQLKQLPDKNVLFWCYCHISEYLPRTRRDIRRRIAFRFVFVLVPQLHQGFFLPPEGRNTKY